jgi:CRP-like cAMP-binding protein
MQATMLGLHSPNQNQLLAALPGPEFSHFLGTLEWVLLPLGKLIFSPGEQLRYAYFPTTAIVSLHYVMESGASAEVAGVGNEGMVGAQLFLGGDTTTSSAVVQTAGYAYRIDRHILMQEFNRAGKLQHVLLRYTQALITQIAQSVVCNRHHTVEQQLSRWLLVTLDRIPSGELVMTQELVASMLGVRREGITQAAGKFQQAGYIRYRRGHISVLDRKGIEAHACECYGVVRQELQRLQQEITL